MRIYLDWAASAPVVPEAMDAFVAASSLYGNPSSPHEEGRVAREALHDARVRIAKLAGVKPRSVIFTSGASESNAIALQGYVRRLRTQDREYEDMHVLYLPTAHASTVSTMEHLSSLGIAVQALPIADGKIDLEALRNVIRPETVLIAVEAVCGETGVRFDTRGIRAAIESALRSGTAGDPTRHIQLHVDASQLPLTESIDRMRLAADTLTLDAQKVGGVRGIGALIVGNVRSVAPIAYGGGQEEGLRPGTEPVALAAAFASALERADAGRAAFSEQATVSREQIVQAIRTLLPGSMIFEARSQDPHILNISFPGIDTDYAVMLLDAKGFAVSTRSACETDSHGSRAVEILTGDAMRAKSTMRISWGPSTELAELMAFTGALAETIHFLERDTPRGILEV